MTFLSRKQCFGLVSVKGYKLGRGVGGPKETLQLVRTSVMLGGVGTMRGVPDHKGGTITLIRGVP